MSYTETVGAGEACEERVRHGGARIVSSWWRPLQVSNSNLNQVETTTSEKVGTDRILTVSRGRSTWMQTPPLRRQTHHVGKPPEADLPGDRPPPPTERQTPTGRQTPARQTPQPEDTLPVNRMTYVCENKTFASRSVTRPLFPKTKFLVFEPKTN